jgi:hypothetical protein
VRRAVFGYLFCLELFFSESLGWAPVALLFLQFLDQHILHASQGVKLSNHERNGKTSDTSS